MLYADEELMLCVYAALYDHRDIGRMSIICHINGRSLLSVKFKIWNIIKTINNENGLLPYFQSENFKPVRFDRIVRYVDMEQAELLANCLNYLRAEGLL